ncbi:M23 family metallopeptidase [Acaryochloris sp. IP29b_bin.137]|uniref:M23 family metallopeptidase n=1 Tax=Acaryochloris sp. IP29b_bin.137 TaxID=2969217 RepID=UPI00344E98AB
MITVSAIGGLTIGQTAHAAVSPPYLKSSTHKPVQLPDLIGSSRYKVSTYPIQKSASVLIASKPDSSSLSSPSLKASDQNANAVAFKTEGSSKSQLVNAGVSFTQSNIVGSSSLSVDELIAPLTSETLLETLGILGFGESESSLTISTSDILGTVTTQAIEPILLAESPRQNLLGIDNLLIQSDTDGTDAGPQFASAPLISPLDLSSTLEQNPLAIGSPESKDDSSEVSASKPADTTQSLAVLPDVDLSQTIIPNDQNSALIDSGAIVHLVKPGETLEDISRLYQVSAQEIKKANRIEDSGSIDPETKLRIPAHQSLSLSLSTVQDIVDLNTSGVEGDLEDVVGKNDEPTSVKAQQGKGDEKASQPTSSASTIAILPAQPTQRNQLNPDTTVLATRNLLPQVPSLDLPPLSSVDRYLPSQMLPGPQKYIWPAKGILTSGFGWRWGRPHRGIDIAAPVGTPVVAAAPGIVTTAGWNRWGYGNLVEIRHPDGSLTLYAHNHRIKTRVGQSVYQGQQIAEMGSTGRSTGPHTHFELHPSDKKGAINPVPFLRKL